MGAGTGLSRRRSLLQDFRIKRENFAGKRRAQLLQQLALYGAVNRGNSQAHPLTSLAFSHIGDVVHVAGSAPAAARIANRSEACVGTGWRDWIAPVWVRLAARIAGRRCPGPILFAGALLSISLRWLVDISETGAPRPVPCKLWQPCAPMLAPRPGQRLPAPTNHPRAPWSSGTARW